MDNKHVFVGGIESGCKYREVGAPTECGKTFTDSIHIETPVAVLIRNEALRNNPNQALIDGMIAAMSPVMAAQAERQKIETIARIAAAIIISGKLSNEDAIDRACYLYERIKATTEREK